MEGEIRDENLDLWAAELEALRRTIQGNIVLNFHSVSFISVSAVPKLMELRDRQVFVLNCPTPVKNMLQASGSVSMIID